MTEPHRRIYALRVNRDTPDLTDAIAKQFGCYRLTPHATIEGSTGILLDKIAEGSLKIIPS
tara:strand:+ start:434 stop:616 length:183 start_codon:yes stop_codon:yes gene_type:complete